MAGAHAGKRDERDAAEEDLRKENLEDEVEENDGDNGEGKKQSHDAQTDGLEAAVMGCIFIMSWLGCTTIIIHDGSQRATWWIRVRRRDTAELQEEQEEEEEGDLQQLSWRSLILPPGCQRFQRGP